MSSALGVHMMSSTHGSHSSEPIASTCAGALCKLNSQKTSSERNDLMQLWKDKCLSLAAELRQLLCNETTNRKNENLSKMAFFVPSISCVAICMHTISAKIFEKWERRAKEESCFGKTVTITPLRLLFLFSHRLLLLVSFRYIFWSQFPFYPKGKTQPNQKWIITFRSSGEAS